jgi:hypothetical protein
VLKIHKDELTVLEIPELLGKRKYQMVGFKRLM